MSRYGQIECSLVGLVLAMTAADGAEAQVAASFSADSVPMAGQGSTSNDGADSKKQDIVVVGTRLGRGDAADVKRRALQSVSVLTAAEIEKLPDTSLGSVLRKIPGVQVSTRDGGASIRIRGLSEIESRINGRKLSSTVNRSFDSAALPADLVSGVDVYKTPSASLLEGGIGGQIDFHSRRPFDFDSAAAAFSAEGSYLTESKAFAPLLSGYVSDRWTTGIGEIGLLVGGSYQRNLLASKSISTDQYNNVGGKDGAAPLATEQPDAVYKNVTRFHQELATAYASAQWKPADSFTLTGDFIYNRQGVARADYNLKANLDGARTGAANATTGRGIWTGVPVSSGTNYETGYFNTVQAAIGGQYVQDRLTLSGEFAYTNTQWDTNQPYVSLASTAPLLSLNLAGKNPTFTIAGVDPAVSSNWRYDSYSGYSRHDDASGWAYRADGIYRFDGPLKYIKVGGLFDRRTVSIIQGSSSHDDLTGLPNPAQPFVSAIDLFGGSQSRWAAPRAFQLHHYADSVRSLLGVPLGRQPFIPTKDFDAVEKVYDGYVEGTFGIPIGSVIIDGNAGVRYARTELTVDGFGRVDTVYEPARTKQTYENWLPQVNVRVKLTPEFLIRLAYSKQVTRPDFWRFNPGITLNTQRRTGSAGNPALKPLRADQYDISAEYYFTKGGSLYAAGFYKHVKGFIGSATRAETIRGETYQITRAYNLSTGWIGGAEVGYDQRFLFLPGALAGLGINASYTYIDSSRPTNSRGVRARLEGLAQHNYQVTGSYDRNGIYAAASWVWSSKIVQSASGDAAGRPTYLAPYGQLDFNLSYDFTKKVSLTASGVNVLQGHNIEYYQDRARLSFNGVEDRRFIMGVRVKLGVAR